LGQDRRAENRVFEQRGSNPSPTSYGCGAVLEQGLRVTGYRVNDFGRVGFGRVRLRVSVTDPVSDLVFVAFARALLLLLVREYATLESLGFCVLSLCFHVVLFTSSDSSNL